MKGVVCSLFRSICFEFGLCCFVGDILRSFYCVMIVRNSKERPGNEIVSVVRLFSASFVVLVVRRYFCVLVASDSFKKSSDR